MKFYKFGFALLSATMLIACGGSNSTTGLAYNAGGTGSYYPNGTQSGCLNANCTSVSINGGTETITYLFPQGATYLNGTYDFSETASVSPGDRVVVNIPSSAYSAKVSFLSTTSNLTSLTISVDGGTGGSVHTYGNMMYASYSIQETGTLKASTNWALWGSGGNHLINFQGGYVAIGHCISTSGAAMTCP